MFSDVMYAAFFDELAHMEIEKLAGVLTPLRVLSPAQQKAMQALSGSSSGAGAAASRAFPIPLRRPPAGAATEAATTVDVLPRGSFGPSEKVRNFIERLGASEAPTVAGATRVTPAPAQAQARGSRALPDSHIARRLRERFGDGKTVAMQPADIASAPRADYRDLPTSTRISAPPVFDPPRRVVTPPPIPREALGPRKLPSIGNLGPAQSDRTVVTRPLQGSAAPRPAISSEAMRTRLPAVEQDTRATFSNPYVPLIGSALERGRALYAA